MSTTETTLSPTWSDELHAMIRDLQDQTISLVLPGLGLVGLLLIVGCGETLHPTGSVILGMALLVLGVGLAFLRRWNAALAAWILVGSTLATALLAASWLGLTPAAWLVVVPVALAMLLISRPAGLLLGVACTLAVLLAPGAYLDASPTMRAVTLVGLWSLLGIIFLALRPMFTTVRWAWSGYRHSQALLEQARDYQAKLHGALDELTSTNMQLSRLNQHTQALRQIAEDERRIKERFVANVSHELRTPLNMIVGFCEMITQAPETYEGAMPPALLADLAVVLRNGQHLSSLIDDVLDLSQVEARQAALVRERVSLHEIVNAAVVAVRPLYASKGLYLETEMADDVPPVFCDRTRIREVLLNLLSNAGRFTESGGVRVRAWHASDELVVSVTDTGPGIAEEDQAKLFKPFQQLDVTVRRRHGGTGLGLAISKSFVELHGGAMWLESAMGRGTTIYFRLPIDPPAPLRGTALRWLNPHQPYEERLSSAPPRPAATRPRLVVVESGNAMHRLLTRHLDGAEVVSAPDLERGIEEVQREPAQALLVNDLQVDEALRRVNGSSGLPYGVPAIICSIPGVEQAAGALGAVDYLVKPVSREALLGALARLGPSIKTVLVVDDEPDALHLFGRLLAASEAGYRVLRAYNGRQALEILRREHPDVMLADLVMPEMDGLELLAAKRQDEACRDIPVILISARDPFGQPIVSSALAATCKDGLSVEQLLAGIEALSAILSKAALSADPAPPGTLAG